MISKELFSEVLKENVKDVYEIGSNPNFKDNTLLFSLNGCGELCNINIYELGHKCKEWAILNHYDFTVLIDTIVIYYKGSQVHTIYNTLEDDNFIPFDPVYEIKACQWILENETYKEENIK